ncbi:hypothetical protein ACFE04_028761 [Oxalis oulophora]
MANSGPSSCYVPLPIFTGKEDYMHWRKKMETLFISQDLWKIIQSDEYQDKRKDAQALYYIQQSLAPPIFSKIISASSAKTAWDILESEYNMAKAHFLDGIDFEAIQISAQLKISCPAGFIKEVPRVLRDVDPAAFTPELISIGPLHQGRPELANMEKHKFHYACSLLQRFGKQKELYVCFIKEREESIRACYLKPSDLSSRDYVEMILLDSFFIIELFDRSENKTAKYADDYLLHDPRFSNSIKLDLLLVENQLPYRLLADLAMNITSTDGFRFNVFSLNYFQDSIEIRADFVILGKRCELEKDFTLNCLVRDFSCRETPESSIDYYNSFSTFESAKKLTKSKVGFYGDDVAVLVEAGVIINMLDSNQAVVDVFDKLCKNFRFEDIKSVFCFNKVCREIDDYCSSFSAW